MPIRIYALAKELGIDTTELLELCQTVGIEGKTSALLALVEEEVELIRFALNGSSDSKQETALTARLAQVSSQLSVYRETKRVESAARAKRTPIVMQRRLIHALEVSGWRLIGAYVAYTKSMYMRFENNRIDGSQTRRLRLSDHFTTHDSDLAVSIVMDLGRHYKTESPSSHGFSDDAFIRVVDGIEVYCNGHIEARYSGEAMDAAIEQVVAKVSEPILSARTGRVYESSANIPQGLRLNESHRIKVEKTTDDSD